MSASKAKLAANARYVKTPRGRVKAKAWAFRYARTPRAKRLRRSLILRKKYGLTIEQWDAMFAAQGYACKACGRTEPASRYGWKTDHNHQTGKVRGILCHGCNIALGAVQDQVVTLMRLATYLERENVQT